MRPCGPSPTGPATASKASMVSRGLVCCREVFDGIRGIPAPGSQNLGFVGLALLCCFEQNSSPGP